MLCYDIILAASLFERTSLEYACHKNLWNAFTKDPPPALMIRASMGGGQWRLDGRQCKNTAGVWTAWCGWVVHYTRTNPTSV